MKNKSATVSVYDGRPADGAQEWPDTYRAKIDVYGISDSCRRRIARQALQSGEYEHGFNLTLIARTAEGVEVAEENLTLEVPTKWAIVNTFTARPGYLGTVESFHRTREAAEKADAALQRSVKRHNGGNSYLPTVIREVDARAKKGMLHESFIAEDSAE